MRPVHLEPWGADDLPLLEKTLGDPAMTEYVGGPESAEKLADRQRRFQQAGSGVFKIVDDVSGEAVGSISVWEREWEGSPVYEIGWFVLPAHQRSGVARQGALEAIERVRSERRLRYLHAFPSVRNEASSNLCRSLGFTLLGERDFEYPPGSWMRCNDWRLDLEAG